MKGQTATGRATIDTGSRWAAGSRALLPVAALFVLPACDGPQSALHPAGVDAGRIAELFWWMAGIGAVIWISVVGLAVYATRPASRPHRASTGTWLIVGGGAVFPTVALAALLIYSLPLMPATRAPGNAGFEIAVSGEQWWWRVRYQPEGGEAVELANEIRLPAGRRVEFELTSPDVIHALWIPSLGGKVDMIPGRVTRMVLEPTKPGVYRGVCAEYCGTSHAFMGLRAVVMEPEAFHQWLEQQATPASPPQSPLAARGEKSFQANGCGACHSVRGTPANGTLGPDLTHVASRLTIGAGMLPAEPEAIRRWVAHTPEIKPAVNMPGFDVLPPEELDAIAAYLSSLE